MYLKTNISDKTLCYRHFDQGYMMLMKSIKTISDDIMEELIISVKPKNETKTNKHTHTHKQVSTHWSRVTHICVGNLAIIGSDNGLSPGRRQAIIWINAVILLIGPLGANFNEISIKSITFPFTKMRLKVSSPKRRPFCLGLNMLTTVKIVHVHVPLILPGVPVWVKQWTCSIYHE